MIYHYGLRVNEATALTLEDIDLKNHRIRLRRLTNGLGGEKPLWRHTAKQLRAYRYGCWYGWYGGRYGGYHRWR